MIQFFKMVHSIKQLWIPSIITGVFLFCGQNGSFQAADVKSEKKISFSSMQKHFEMKHGIFRSLALRKLMSLRGGYEGSLACKRIPLDQGNSLREEFVEASIKARRTHEELKASHAKMKHSAVQVHHWQRTELAQMPFRSVHAISPDQNPPQASLTTIIISTLAPNQHILMIVFIVFSLYSCH